MAAKQKLSIAQLLLLFLTVAAAVYAASAHPCRGRSPVEDPDETDLKHPANKDSDVEAGDELVKKRSYIPLFNYL
uniref:Uncharacterized protein n=1 Tax=Macrostomum lignano TaxID=282301 RepID=A0A1I8HCB4_9PLAT